MGSETPRREIANIQALRAAAALLVACGHYASHPGALPPSISNLLGWCAYGGVDIFFVISGLIVSQAAARTGVRVAQEGRLRPAFDFACRRVFRIYPLYWVALATAVGLEGWIQIAVPEWPHASPLATISLGTMWIGSLSSAWSLAFEAYFYAVMTIVILIAGRHVYRGLFVWMLLQLIWINAPGLDWPGWSVGSNELVYEFCFGVIVALAADRWRGGGAWLLLLISVPCFAQGMWLTAHDGLLPPVPRVATFGIGSACLLFALLGFEARGLRAPRWLQRVGNASYSIYLWHMILFGIVVAIFPAPTIARALGAGAMLLAVGFASYGLIERPAQRFGAWLGRLSLVRLGDRVPSVLETPKA